MAAGSGMKKVFVTPLDSVSDKDREGIGTIRFEGDKVYKYVQYKEGTGALDVASGDVVYWLDREAVTVTADVSDTDDVGAGVIQGAVTEDGKFIWIQIKGLAELNTDVTAGAVGNALTAVGADDKTLDVSAANTDAVVAFLEDVTGGANKIYCDFPW